MILEFIRIEQLLDFTIKTALTLQLRLLCVCAIGEFFSRSCKEWIFNCFIPL